MRKPLLALATVLLACILTLSSGVVALAGSAAGAQLAGTAGFYAPGGMPPVSPKGFIAPIPPRDPNAKPISTAGELQAMANGGNYYLTQDIDLSGYNGGVWQPLQVSVTLDGQGHIIRNLRIPASAHQRVVGLFEVVLMKNDFTVKNLGIQLGDGGITAYNALADDVVTEYPVFAGGLVGVVDSNYPGDYSVSISNCYVSGDVTGTASGVNQHVLAGGLVGMATWCVPISIVDCYTTGHVSSTGDRGETSIGGLVGSLGTGTVDHCYSSCGVSAMNGDVVRSGVHIGGLAGSIYQVSITNSHAIGAVSANTSFMNIGGLVGAVSKSVVSNCSASGKVSATTPANISNNSYCIVSAGGLVGQTDSPISSAPTITGCFSTGSVDASVTNNPAGAFPYVWAGGLVGALQNCGISNCYATGAAIISATCNASAGGLVGNMDSSGAVTNCYVTGLVSSTVLGSTGGIAGEAFRSPGITNSYFDNQTTGQAQATGDGVSAPDAGKTTDQMKSQAIYAGWDFASVWSIGSERNNGYPYLQWQYVYRVFFDSQGGSDVASQNVNDGAYAAAPAEPTRAGYAFTGWYKDSAGSVPWNFTVDTVTGDTTLYAMWIATIPMGVKAASVSSSAARVSWESVPGAAGYEVCRATSSTGTFAPVGAVTDTRFTNTGLTAGKVYYYKVRAYRLADGAKVYGDYSAVISYKHVPVAPTGLKAVSVSYSSVKLTWGAVAGAKKYEVYRATSKSGTYAKLTETSSASYTNNGLTAGKAYYYKVRAYWLVGGKKVYGNYSAVESAKPVPANPTGVKAVRVSSTSVKVSWSKVMGANGYEVYRALAAGGTYSMVKSTTSLNWTNTKLTSGKTYYYKVRAYRLVGSVKVYGGYSAVVSVIP